MEKSRVLTRIPEPLVSARARARLPRTEGSRHSLSSPQPSLGGPRGEATRDPQGPQACSQAATTLRGSGAKVPRVQPRVPGPRVPQPRHAPSPQPRPALLQARRAHSGSATQHRPATREVQLCRPVASRGPHSGAGDPDGIAGSLRELT